MRKKGEHGKDFHYVTANSEVSGWVIEKVTGTGFAHVFEQKVFGKIGAERDAFYATDPHGKAVSGGGLNITARDALRLARHDVARRQFNSQQIVPAAVVAKITAGSTPRPSLWGNENGGHDHSYMSQWYIDHSRGRRVRRGHPRPDDPLSAEDRHRDGAQSSYPKADGAFFVVLDDFFAAVAERLTKE